MLSPVRSSNERISSSDRSIELSGNTEIHQFHFGIFGEKNVLEVKRKGEIKTSQWNGSTDLSFDISMNDPFAMLKAEKGET